MAASRYDLEWCADRSIRYHDRRRAYYETVDAVGSAFSLFGGSVAIGALLKSWPDQVVIAFAAIAAVSGFVQVIMRPAEMAGKHERLKQQFTEMRIRLQKLPDSASEAELGEVETFRFEIERDEPSIYRMLDLICHNELALAQGKKSDESLSHISLWQRATANFWHWDTDSVPSVAEYKLARNKKAV